MKKKTLLLCTLLCVLLLTACGGKAAAEGWYLRAENGASLLVTDGGEPITLSDQSGSGDLFQGLTSGDRIRMIADKGGAV